MAQEGFYVRVSGASELVADLNAMMTQAMPEVSERAASELGRFVADAARFPVISGTLRRSVTVRPAPRYRGAGGVDVQVGVVYAGPVEFGGWPRGRPFLRGGRYLWPYVVRARARAEETWEQGLSTMINHYRWSHP